MLAVFTFCHSLNSSTSKHKTLRCCKVIESIYFNSDILKYFRTGKEKIMVRCYVENVVSSFTKEDFRRMFRMNPATFTFFLEHVRTLSEIQLYGNGRRNPIWESDIYYLVASWRNWYVAKISGPFWCFSIYSFCV